MLGKNGFLIFSVFLMKDLGKFPFITIWNILEEGIRFPTGGRRRIFCKLCWNMQSNTTKYLLIEFTGTIDYFSQPNHALHKILKNVNANHTEKKGKKIFIVSSLVKVTIMTFYSSSSSSSSRRGGHSIKHKKNNEGNL